MFWTNMLKENMNMKMLKYNEIYVHIIYLYNISMDVKNIKSYLNM